MTRYTLTVPLTLNDGTRTPAAELSRIERELLSIAGGFTATAAELWTAALPRTAMTQAIQRNARRVLCDMMSSLVSSNESGHPMQ